MTAFSGWQNFYVIVGSSAGALIGLQFVVITLIADAPGQRDLQRAGSAFATPTIAHFGSVLLLSAVLCAPWPTSTPAAVLCGLVGIIGVVYSLIVLRRIRTQAAYTPVFDDWLFYLVLPLVAYATLAGSAFAAGSGTFIALFGVAGAALLLLFVGIRNAWDSVTYHVFTRHRRDRD